MSMDRDSVYISSIPADAHEKVTAKYGKIGPKRAEYYVGKEVVGIREFFMTGEPESEWSFTNGMLHGWYYGWYEPGKLMACEPHENGVPHGTAYQWTREGALMGSYTMIHGNGIDLWWHELEDGSVVLKEAYYKVEGKRHGFEWWLNDNGSAYEERHWNDGRKHGIEREWNPGGGLRRGFPRYYVGGAQVTKRQYVAACKKDTTLPAFSIEDNAPRRTFPSGDRGVSAALS